MVVEDEKRVSVVVREFLRLAGHTVLEATHVDEAIELCQAHGEPIHLLLTDVVMPGMDGPALARRLARICPGFQVLYMTGYPDDILVRHGVSPGCVPLIRKPFTVQALAAKLREMLA
jgi:CheY-like chemotaxis protein